MSYKLGALAASLILLFGLSQWRQPLTVEDIAVKGLPSVVRIMSTEPGLATAELDLKTNIVTVKMPRTSLTTGFVISKYGHIMTVAHGINSKIVDVEFWGGRAARAAVIYVNRKMDVAILRVPELPDGVSTLEFEEEPFHNIGSLVVAIGHPDGDLTWSVTSGIVSRNYVRPWPEFQTDAISRPGNSGSPYLNNQGKVIGMFQRYRTPPGSGIAFAISGAVMRDVSRLYTDL